MLINYKFIEIKSKVKSHLSPTMRVQRNNITSKKKNSNRHKRQSRRKMSSDRGYQRPLLQKTN